MAPVRTIQIRKKHNSWISEDCKQMMKRRDILQRQAAQTNNPNTWRAYKDIRNKINNRLRYEERVWKQKRLSEVKGDSGKSWKVIKNILNWKSSEAPTKLFKKVPSELNHRTWQTHKMSLLYPKLSTSRKK